jgi:23S rRNA (uracil1939-C5)-methyltransferase
MLGPYHFIVSHDAFFQVNTSAAATLCGTIADMSNAGARDSAIDFYCGTGSISIFLAERAGRVEGVDSSECAIKDARANADKNGVKNLTFTCRDAERAAAGYARDGARPDIVVLDPPRRGCGKSMISSIKAIGAERIIYVSCDPATLSRDAALLSSFGGAEYGVDEVRPVDMFPRTANIETVTLFIRKH